MSGFGRIVCADGAVYEGPWKDAEPVGHVDEFDNNSKKAASSLQE